MICKYGLKVHMLKLSKSSNSKIQFSIIQPSEKVSLKIKLNISHLLMHS